MFRTLFHTLPFSKSLLSLFLGALLALTALNPAPVQAQGRGNALGAAIFLGAVGTIAYCAANPGKCDASGAPRGGGGPVDAIALTREQAMWVQQGLQYLGFYQGAIDGAIGAGSRASIRAYQASIGESQTGAMTGKQINDLVTLAPMFRDRAPDDVFLFNADLANDVTPDEMRMIQAALNRHGFNAGSVDGAFGGMTRNAVAAYKASYALPGGPVASRRLLAHLNGESMPTPVVTQTAPSGAQKPGAAMPMPAAPQPPQPVVPAPMGDVSYELLGVSLGMTPGEVDTIVDSELGAGLVRETALGEAFAGGTRFGLGTLAAQPGWPGASSEAFLALYDAAHPELGLLAAFRLIVMPEGVDQATFESQVLPSIQEHYGTASQVGDNLWIGKAAARAGDPAACGALDLAEIGTGGWSTGTGPKLDALSLGSVGADCGPVLRVSYDGSVVRIGMWNSATLSGAVPAPAAPAIKF